MAPFTHPPSNSKSCVYSGREEFKGKGTQLPKAFLFFGLHRVFLAVCGFSLVLASGQGELLRLWTNQLWLKVTGASVVVANGLSCLLAHGISPDQESSPCPLHWLRQGGPREASEIMATNVSWDIYLLYTFSSLHHLISHIKPRWEALSCPFYRRVIGQGPLANDR